MTDYIVLAKIFKDTANTIQGDDGNHFMWQYATQAQARSARSAIAQAAALFGEQDLTDPTEFVAVPARSWKPVTVKVETKTQLKFS